MTVQYSTNLKPQIPQIRFNSVWSTCKPWIETHFIQLSFLMKEKTSNNDKTMRCFEVPVNAYLVVFACISLKSVEAQTGLWLGIVLNYIYFELKINTRFLHQFQCLSNPNFDPKNWFEGISTQNSIDQITDIRDVRINMYGDGKAGK